jgi:uncharacterized cysteine cluster protein YcgN (CxxCxxCC family)
MKAGNWWDKALQELTPDEWENLCDGCGKCCLHKIEDEDSGAVYLTAVACEFLDLKKTRCRCYAKRTAYQPACLVIAPEAFPAILPSLPNTCAYRLRWEGKSLPVWHPLLNGGSSKNMQLCGHSVRDRVISEQDLDHSLDDDEWQDLIIEEWSDTDADS